MKPDWKDAPKWAQWLAMDKNGLWVWFENKPQTFSGITVWANATNGGRHALAKIKNPNNWRKTLESRPEE